jgi:hypothetical protein
MDFETTCDLCKRHFVLSETDAARVERAKANGMHALIVKCTHCETSTVVQWAEKPNGGLLPPLRCPVSGCDGHVVEVTNDGPAYWGCGHCSSQWRDFANLQKEITAIVKRFPYRKKSYRKEGSQWVAAGHDKEISDYEERVEKEPMDESNDERRG